MKQIILFLIVLSQVCSCGGDAETVKVVRLKTKYEMNALSDSTYFNNINSILEYKGDIYISVDQRMQIIRMSKDLKLKSYIGKYGKGNGEFSYINSFNIYNDTLYAGNSGKLSYMMFALDGEFISDLSVSKNRYTMDNRFVISDDKIFISKIDFVMNSSKSILNISDGEYHTYGDFNDFNSEVKNSIQNEADLFELNNEIIAVYKSIPLIERYDMKFNLLEEYNTTDIDHIHMLNEFALLNKRVVDDKNSAYLLVSDAYLVGDLLYVLYYPSDNNFLDEDMYNRSSIFVFDVGTVLKPVKQIILDDNVTKICVTNRYLYAVPFGGGCLKQYELY